MLVLYALSIFLVRLVEVRNRRVAQTEGRDRPGPGGTPGPRPPEPLEPKPGGGAGEFPAPEEQVAGPGADGEEPDDLREVAAVEETDEEARETEAFYREASEELGDELDLD